MCEGPGENVKEEVYTFELDRASAALACDLQFGDMMDTMLGQDSAVWVALAAGSEGVSSFTPPQTIRNQSMDAGDPTHVDVYCNPGEVEST